MPTVVTRYINTGSTAGGDGTTNATSGANRAWPSLNHALGELNTAYSSSLVGADVQVDLIAEGATDDATTISNSWPTSDSTRYIHLQVPVADRKVPWDDNGYTYGTAPNFAAALVINTNSFRMTGIQLYHAGSLDVGGNYGIAITGSSGGVHVYDGVKVWKTTNAGQHAFAIADTPGTYVFRNCVSGGVTFRFRGFLIFGAGVSNTTILAYSNTGQFAGTSTSLSLTFTSGGSNKVVRLKDNLWQADTNGIVVTNATTDDRATNHTATTTDASFVDDVNGNFRLTSTDTVARNFGTDLSGVADWPFDWDADLTTRPVGSAWDIGAHEQTTPDAEELIQMVLID